MLRKIFVPAAVMAMVGSSAFAAETTCVEPPLPMIPDGKTASNSDLTAARAAVVAYGRAQDAMVSVARRGDADQSAQGRDHGPLQGGLGQIGNCPRPVPISGQGGRFPLASSRAMSAPRQSRLLTALLVAPAGVLFFFLLVLPLAVVLVYSFGERAPAGGYAPGLTLGDE